MDKNCTIYRTVSLIGKKWTLLVLLELYKGKMKWKRYSYLKRHLPRITPKMLSARLKELEKEGIISKKIDTKTLPIKCEYSLEASGEDIISVLRGIKKWGIDYRLKNQGCVQRDCQSCEL